MNRNFKILLMSFLTFFSVEFMTAKAQANENEQEKEFVKIEKMPSFPGGEQKRYNFIKKNLKYPKEAKKSGIKGTVMVSFVIDSTGIILQETIEIVKSVHPLLDKEALRVVKLFPKWTPAYTAEGAVKSQFHLPIRFN